MSLRFEANYFDSISSTRVEERPEGFILCNNEPNRSRRRPDSVADIQVEGEFIYSIPFRADEDDPLWAAASYAHALLIDGYEKTPIEEKFFPVNPRVAAGCGSGPTDDDQDLVFNFKDMVGYFFIGVVALAVAVVAILIGKGAKKYRARRARPDAPEEPPSVFEEDVETPLEAVRREIRGLREQLEASERKGREQQRSRRKSRSRERRNEVELAPKGDEPEAPSLLCGLRHF